MYKTKLFRMAENYATLDLEVGYKSFVDILLQEVCKRLEIDECDKDKIINYFNTKEGKQENLFLVMLKDVLEKIEYRSFDYEYLINIMQKFELLLEKINFKNFY